MSWDKTEGGDFGHSGGTSRAENFIRGLNIELANERNLRAKAEAEVERLRNENAKLKKALELANSNRMCTECKLLVYCFNKGRHTMPKGCVESWLEQAELEDGK